MTLARMMAGSLALALAAQAAWAGGFQTRVVTDRSVRSGEPAVAVNPTDARNIAFFAMTQELPYAAPGSPRWTQKGYMDCRMSVSFDGGHTWAVRPNPFITGRQTLCADPMLVFGLDGTLYAGADAMSIDPTNPKRWLLGEVEVARSSDGGKTWTSPVLTGTPFDRPFLVVDASDGTLYLSSSCIDPIASYCRRHSRYVLASRDHGLSWSPRDRLGTPRYPSLGEGTIAAANGWLAVGYVSPKSAEDPHCPCLVFGRTRNAGASWTHSIVPTAQPIGMLAQVAADPKRLDTYAIVVQSRDGLSYLVYVTRDAGRSWHGPGVIANEPRRTAFKSWVAFSPDGVLGVVWRAYIEPPRAAQALQPRKRGKTPALTFPYALWGVISRDGGESFSRPLLLSGSPSPASPSGQDGPPDDESFVLLDHGEMHYAWGDWRGGDLSAWYGRVPLADFQP